MLERDKRSSLFGLVASAAATTEKKFDNVDTKTHFILTTKDRSISNSSSGRQFCRLPPTLNDDVVAASTPTLASLESVDALGQVNGG
jgi:hypothetical protein